MASSSAAGAPNVSNFQQLKEYAITLSGYGLKHGLEKRKEYQYIQTHPVSSIAVEKVQKRLNGSETGLKSSPSIPSILSNRREKELPSDNRTICALVVGLYLSKTGAFDITKAPIIEADKGTNKGMPVGKEIPISLEEFDHSPVFRVVVKVVEEMPEEGAKLYVLLEEKDGLPMPYRVAQSKVFFFDEFRDDSPSQARREVSWMANVKKHSVMEEKARDTSKLACGPKEGLRNSLAEHLVLLGALEGPPPEDILRLISNTLRSSYTDMYQRDMPSSETIDAFVDRGSTWDQTCTSNFISAIKRVWPYIQLTEEIVHALRAGLREAELSVDYRDLKGFLIEGSFIIENEIQAPGVARTMTNEEVAIAALLVAQRHKQVDTTPRPSIQTVQDKEAWVRMLKEGLKNLVQGTADWNKTAIDNLGDIVMKVDSWTAVFKGHSSARDGDAQKMLSASLARSMFSQITIKHDGTIKVLEEMIRLTEMWLNRASQ
ncbi:uncharacterized protein EAE97_007588 [Botrytis byssoidea]|uniref:Uncharacterized protein n=1 Tax=Botrytis byssoidea TaxID=139641 RepID=A0A9P5II62_9HELO|nr:uncharacterized protein EAE97_007588 [Botrytis byssoidea]KAF7937792.1 hypothetical protein EAE97_007588 [Botrytis byssoidea]